MLLTFVGLISAAGVVLSLCLWLTGTDLSLFGPRVSVPRAHAVDEDRFLGNFHGWGVLSNFVVIAPDPANGGSNQWTFRVECDLKWERRPLEQHHWYVEVYAKGDLVTIAELPIDIQKPDEPDSEKPFLESRHSLAGVSAGRPYQFFTYLARRGAMKTRVPISGILEWGGGPTPEQPVVYDRNIKKREMIRLSNPDLTLSDFDSSIDDSLKIDFEVIDDSFLLDFKPHENRYDGPVYYLNVENKFGSIARYTTGRELTRQRGDFVLGSHNHSHIESENHHLKRLPLRVYITREKPKPLTSTRRGLLQPVELFSNILVIE